MRHCSFVCVFFFLVPNHKMYCLKKGRKKKDSKRFGFFFFLSVTWHIQACAHISEDTTKTCESLSINSQYLSQSRCLCFQSRWRGCDSAAHVTWTLLELRNLQPVPLFVYLSCLWGLCESCDSKTQTVTLLCYRRSLLELRKCGNTLWDFMSREQCRSQEKFLHAAWHCCKFSRQVRFGSWSALPLLAWLVV